MSSKTQLNQHITRLNKQCGELAQAVNQLEKQLEWANTQVGALTLQLKEAKKPWWKKLPKFKKDKK